MFRAVLIRGSSGSASPRITPSSSCATAAHRKFTAWTFAIPKNLTFSDNRKGRVNGHHESCPFRTRHLRLRLIPWFSQRAQSPLAPDLARLAADQNHVRYVEIPVWPERHRRWHGPARCNLRVLSLSIDAQNLPCPWSGHRIS